MSVRLIVCGGRDYAFKGHVFSVLDTLHEKRTIVEIIEGGARGADAFAAAWAVERGVLLTTVHANWNDLKLAGGPARNKAMLEHGPDGVVAFPGGSGTANMCALAEAAGVPVMRVK